MEHEEMDKLQRQLQLTQVELLKVLDKICRDNGLKYSLYAGTLIGAVRHHGFIPWDDDLDVCMSRADYDRLLELWPTQAPKGYLLQNKENSPAFPQSFTKIRKDRTTFLQSDTERDKYHLGIFVDIFPIDRIPSGWLRRLLYKWDCMRYQLYTREFAPPKGSIPVRLVSKFLLWCVPASQRPTKRAKLLKKLTAHNTDENLPEIAIETMSTIRQILPKDLMDHVIDIPFEGENFMCFARWHDYLTIKYGDYMQLPPEEDRVWKHHPLIIDFEHNYEELNAGM